MAINKSGGGRQKRMYSESEREVARKIRTVQAGRRRFINAMRFAFPYVYWGMMRDEHIFAGRIYTAFSTELLHLENELLTLRGYAVFGGGVTRHD